MDPEISKSTMLKISQADRLLLDRVRQKTTKPSDWLQWIVYHIRQPIEIQKNSTAIQKKYPLTTKFPHAFETALGSVYNPLQDQNIRTLAHALIAGDIDNASRICENIALSYSEHSDQAKAASDNIPRISSGKIINTPIIIDPDYQALPDLWRQLPTIQFTAQQRIDITQAVTELDQAIPLEALL